jgi:hypothetical protein
MTVLQWMEIKVLFVQGIFEKVDTYMPFDFAQENVRLTHHERNQLLTVRHEPVEGLVQRFLNSSLSLPDFYLTD